MDRKIDQHTIREQLQLRMSSLSLGRNHANSKKSKEIKVTI